MRKKMVNKKALATAEIVVILVLILIAAAALIFFFGRGSLSVSNFLDNLLVGSKDAVVQGCNVANLPNAYDAWCCQVRKYKEAGDIFYVTCNSAQIDLQLENRNDINCEGKCSKLVCTTNLVECAEENVDKTKTLKQNLEPINPKTEVCCKV